MESLFCFSLQGMVSFKTTFRGKQGIHTAYPPLNAPSKPMRKCSCDRLSSCSLIFLYTFQTTWSSSQAYSWALEGMKFVTTLKMEECCNEEACNKMIEQFDSYMENNPPISEASGCKSVILTVVSLLPGSY